MGLEPHEVSMRSRRDLGVLLVWMDGVPWALELAWTSGGVPRGLGARLGACRWMVYDLCMHMDTYMGYMDMDMDMGYMDMDTWHMYMHMCHV